VPVKIIKENCYPQKLDQKQIDEIVNKIIDEYKELLKLKKFKTVIDYKNDEISFKVKKLGSETRFNIRSRTVSGEQNSYSEDFRDFLRARGIKFFIDKPFDQIIPEDFQRWLK
jgi:hypothetical protein